MIYGRLPTSRTIEVEITQIILNLHHFFIQLLLDLRTTQSQWHIVTLQFHLLEVQPSYLRVLTRLQKPPLRLLFILPSVHTIY